MAAQEYTWSIIEVNNATATMLVDYRLGESSIVLNLPMPKHGTDLNEWVRMFAPKSQWEASLGAFAAVQPGIEGVGIFEPTVEVPSEAPNVVGSWNEEYLRALIYQIMEEMNETQV